MPNPKKLKKWRSQARQYAEIAEESAERAEAALARVEALAGRSAPGSPAGDPDRSEQRSRGAAYTTPHGLNDTPPAAEVP